MSVFIYDKDFFWVNQGVWARADEEQRLHIRCQAAKHYGVEILYRTESTTGQKYVIEPFLTFTSVNMEGKDCWLVLPPGHRRPRLRISECEYFKLTGKRV